MHFSLGIKNSTQQKVADLLCYRTSFEAYQASAPAAFNLFLNRMNQVWQFLVNIFQKKPTFYFLLFSSLLCVLPVESSFAANVPSNMTHTFMATAYYSPLPDQETYYRGSYEADVALNGGGISAADGTGVYAGMIAAPSTYPFGTKIYLDGLGIVSVHDRWGAIVKNDDGSVAYDRIDIWMGYGDEWLKRTLAWGKREILGALVEKTLAPTLNLETVIENAPDTYTVALKKFAALGYVPGDSSMNAREKMIEKFQLDYGVIADRSDPGAGSYGPKTTLALANAYNAWLRNNTPSLDSASLIEKHDSYDGKTNMTKQDAEKLAENMRTVRLGTAAESIVNLQEFLEKTGNYHGMIDGVMTLEVLGALRKYQHSLGLPQTGRVDLRTQQYIIRELQ